ncbi:flavoprotein [Mucisphaera calidilacus]|uniref:Phosphopantothenoylcysteine decarboxylase n=1 Tax=Mucisphaera calidilacus TaxID=2527982 RepID=A0A518BXF4_9BACT|nr:flavoprotein [Mucisphaera calidilacus]QDU71636.1 Phosphopantothenoylcysteine decarboxylase [Mucisphaera calidilacus]
MNDGNPPAPPQEPDASASPLSGRRVLLAVTGGIAAYKAASLASALVKAGTELRVVMTESAQRFIGPTTFASLSGRPVITSIWQTDDRPDAQHVAVARDADLMVIAPATANTLAKIAAGLCDDPVSLAASALPAGTPLVIAPAMNADMWANPINQRNLKTLREYLPGLSMVDPESGWQACRTEGRGRMAEPETILLHVTERLSQA